MSRITEKLIEAKQRGGGFIPFVTAGDPDAETSLSIILKLAEMGADVIELGVPFTDPMADGPTIQLSSQRALDNGMTLPKVLEISARFRAVSDVPIVLFSYFNPIMRYGIERFRDAAAAAGVDGVLLTDVIEDEAAEISAALAERNIDLISLIVPTTSDERLAAIADRARGFIYAVSRAGVTGARQETSSTAQHLVERVKRNTNLPVAVGFGISTAEQITATWQYAEAAVVGSAIVAEIARTADPLLVTESVGKFVGQLLPRFANEVAEN